MYTYISIISLVTLTAILSVRYIGIKKGKEYYMHDGLAEFYGNSKELFNYIKRLYRFAKKVFLQYGFHFIVRMLYYIKNFWEKAYARSRNRFMKTAVKDKKAVSRFWETLKEYKQEIDEERKK